MVYRTARAGLRLTRGQRRRLVGLLISAGDVWACILELNAWRRARQARPLASYQELCRLLAASAPSTASITTTPRPTAGRLHAALPGRVSADRGAGASTAAASAWSRRGTGAG